MYSYGKRSNKIKKILILIVLMAVVSATSIFVYNMYINIDVTPYSDSSDGTATRMSNKQIVEEEQESNTTDMLEGATEAVVGISKIKNMGSSIFSSDSASTLGLGTGIIVSDSGYILTNWHVAGNKYSNCYITLKDGNTHNGNVVWADEDLDLAIVKINIKGVKYFDLGDSDNIKLGETVYAIGNPIGVEFQGTVTGRNN